MDAENKRGTPLIAFEDATIRLRERFILPGTTWEIKTGEHWAVLGANGAGKSSLLKAIIGDLPCVRGRIVRRCRANIRQSIGHVSFDLQEYLVVQEEIRDLGRDFTGKHEGRRRVREVILEGFFEAPARMETFDGVVDLLGLRGLLGRGIRCLSTGEARKALIARALMTSPRMLLLDEPFAGLDSPSRQTVQDAIEELMARGVQVVLATHRQEEIFPGISHVICMKDGKVFLQGPREETLTPENLTRLYSRGHAPGRPAPPRGRRRGFNANTPEIMIEMRQATVRYGETTVLDRLDWTVKRGENWAVLGPNGAGKTTLMSLVTADHPQAYANEIYLFGKRRGTGESIWEIKRHIGMVSAELQLRYRRDIRAWDVVASGLFDSIGLYRRLTAAQRKQVEKWLNFLAIACLGERIFTRLSYGERRLVLLARAMVKAPSLLILDEPCQGLDQENRDLFLHMVETIGSRTEATVVYVTHFENEIPRCIDRVLNLKRPGKAHITEHRHEGG